MSAPRPASAPDDSTLQPGAWRHGLSDYQVVNKLMKRMGSKSFDPIPPDQHQWQRHLGYPPSLNPMWSWLCDHTIHWGRRSEYAVNSNSEELYLEHMAKDLGREFRNVCGDWRVGVRLGIWRNGTKDEGRRRLYLCGKIELNTEGAPVVCTDHWPPYIANQIEDWSPEKVAELRQRWYDHEEAFRTAHSEVLAVLREVAAEGEDALFKEYGIRKNRLARHKTKETPEAAEARAGRMKPIRDGLRRFVRTTLDCVQTQNAVVFKAAAATVQTAPTLLGQRTSRERPEERAGSNSDAPQGPRGAHHSNEGKRSNSIRVAQLPQLVGEDQQAEALLFSEIARMQNAYPHTDFSREQMSPSNTGDQIFVRRVLETVGAENVTQFLLWVADKFKGLGVNALGKKPRAPGHPHGPNSLGLILCWADDYREKMDEAALEAAGIDLVRLELEIDACRQILADPTETLDAKVYAADLLKMHRAKP